MKNKKLLIIIGSVVVLLVAGIVVFSLTKGNNDNEPKEEPKTEEQILAEKEPPKETPATNTEELITKVEKAEVKEITKDKVIFSEESNVKKGDVVAVWVYSEPKFLGYFKVKEVNGQKVIEGLEEKLAKLEIESGKHNIAITTETGEPIGYVDVTIEEEGNFKEEVLPYTKEVTETQEIKFKTTTKVNNSLAKGTSKTIQEGVNGEKEIKYEVTYDGTTNEEISRKKISETTTKEAVEKIVETGGADFNLKTAKITSATEGFICKKSEINKEYGGCFDGEGAPEFEALAIDGTYYAICKSNSSSCKTLGFKSVKLTRYDQGYTAKIKGTTYYFDGRAGGAEPRALKQADCTKYNLTCATW